MMMKTSFGNMNTVHFYINSKNRSEPLIDLVTSYQHPLYIHTNNLEHAKQLDTLLWDNDRFIPHVLGTEAPSSVILIGYQAIPQNRHILNASDQQLDLVHIEWVTNNVELARERYRYWQKHNRKLVTHQL